MMLQGISSCDEVSSKSRIGPCRPLVPGYRKLSIATISGAGAHSCWQWGGVQGSVTQPHTLGEALGVHIVELLDDLQRGAIP